LRNPSDQESEDAAERPSARCSFCLQDSRESGTLIEGPNHDKLGAAYICYNCVYICAVIFEDKKQEILATEDAAAASQFVLTPLSQMIEKTLKTLTEPESKVVKLRYGLGDGYNHTLEEVGRRLKLTAEDVRRYEIQAVTKLRSQSQPPLKP
jgi:DNA-directed RNA polymerase specialized sigma subunit